MKEERKEREAMKRYRYIAGCSVSLADGSFGEIDIPCPRLYASEDEAWQAEGRNAYRLIHVGGVPGEDGFEAFIAVFGKGTLERRTDESGNPYIEEKTGDLLYTITEDEFIRNGGAIFRERQDENGIWERGEKISGGFAVMCDRSTAGRELYMDHDCYWIAEVDA